MAGFPSQYSKELWQQARDLIGQGFSFPEVSDRTGIGLSNLKMKSQREEWFVPATAIQRGNAALQQREQKMEVCPSVTTEALVAESIAETGQKGAKYVVDGLIEVIRRTFDPSSALMTKEITSHKEASSMFGMFAKASGLDKPQQAVQVNLWTQGSGAVQSDDAS